MPEAAIGADKSRRKVDKPETVRNVIRAVVDLDKSTPLMVPIPEGNRGLALEMCARISRQLKWVGVGRHLFKYASGSVEFITSGKASLLYGQIIDCPYLTEALLRCVSRLEMGVIRDLTLKVTLMDILQESSGVEWAWARMNVPQRDIIDLSSLGHWHYDAIFVNCEAIEYAVRNEGRLPGGTKGDYWSIVEGRPPLSVCRQTRDHTIWAALR